MLWEENYLAHYGIKGQSWGLRRFQNEDGTLTEEGKARYGIGDTNNVDSKKDASTNNSKEKSEKIKKILSVAAITSAAVIGGTIAFKKGKNWLNALKSNYVKEANAYRNRYFWETFGATKNYNYDYGSAKIAEAQGNRYKAGLLYKNAANTYLNSLKYEKALNVYDDIVKNASTKNVLKNYFKNNRKIVLTPSSLNLFK